MQTHYLRFLVCLHKHTAPAQCRTLPGLPRQGNWCHPKYRLISILPPRPKQLLVEGISSVSALCPPHSALAPGRQTVACVLASLTSKPTSEPKVTSMQGVTCPSPATRGKAGPSCTCISEIAPSHLKTRSHTPHRRGTGLCAAAHPPAGSRQVCRPAGTLPACPARRRGCRPGSRRRNTSGLAGEIKNEVGMPIGWGCRGISPSW